MMDQKLKERVFGALVVVAIAVIFVPMILDPKHEEAVNLSESMPNPPVADASQLASAPEGIVELEMALDETPDIAAVAAASQAQMSKPAKKQQAEKIAKAVPANTQAVAEIQKARQAAAEKAKAAPKVAKVAEPKAAPKVAKKAEPKPAPAKKSEPKVVAKAQPKEIPMATMMDDFMAANDVTGMSPINRNFVPKTQQSVAQAPAVSEEPKVAAVAQTKKSAPVEVIAAAPAPIQKGWAVQMGAFSNENNARALEQKIKKQGYDAFLQEVATSNRILTKVMVGPKSERTDADDLRANLEANTNLRGVVIRYEPLV